MHLESVTVTATKASQAAIDSFIGTRATATRVANKLARWRRAICPETQGLGPTYAKFVTGRIREIAETIGARVDEDEKCTPNIEIVFTTAPQGLLDNVRKEHPSYLGYYDNQSQADKLATVTYPIQSWYTTATGDLTGEPQVDGGKKQGVEFQALSMTVTAPGGSGAGAQHADLQRAQRNRAQHHRLAQQRRAEQRVLPCPDRGRAGQAVRS